MARPPSVTIAPFPPGGRSRGAAGPKSLLTSLLVVTLACSAGCTSPREYIRNGFKVGPNYRRPVAPVEQQWIDEADPRVSSSPAHLAAWWHTFNDPVLSGLVETAYSQNLTVRQAGFRVLQARAELGIARGLFFPQRQAMQGSYTRTELSRATVNRAFLPEGVYSNWDYGFSLGWELDVWGRYRRQIEGADANLDASIEDYDAVLVTMVGDIAQAYVQLRAVEQQLVYVATNVKLQQETLDIAKARFAGGQATDLDVEQSLSILNQTESQIPELEIQRRQLNNQLCVLLGIPMEDLEQRLGHAKIPTAPPQVVVGIPADLLRRRPDVRAEERRTAAESARIGVAAADLYPSFSLTGSMGWSAKHFSDLFNGNAFDGSVAPGFSWNILNYGRILNNIDRADARFEAQVATYQQTVLQAGQEAEDALVQFLRSQQQAQKLALSVAASEKAVAVVTVQYKGGLVDFNRVSVVEQNLVQQQLQYAQAQANIAVGLVQLYRALGGGWEIRLNQGAVVQEIVPAAAVEGAPAVDDAPPPVAPPVKG